MADTTMTTDPAALLELYKTQQKDQHNRLASASPQLLDLLAEYGLIEPQQVFAMKQMQEAEKMRDTPMPQGMTVRDQYIAPSVFGVADAALRRGMGWSDAEKEKQAIQAGFLRKMQANRAIGQNEQDFAKSQLAAQAAAEPQPGAGEGIVTPREIGSNFIPEGTPTLDANGDPQSGPMHILSKTVLPPRKPPVDPRGRSAGVTSPFFGFGDSLGVNGRK